MAGYVLAIHGLLPLTFSSAVLRAFGPGPTYNPVTKDS